jgi:CBS domain-containing protein
MTPRTAVFRALVRDHMRPTAIAVAASDPSVDVVGRMRAAGATSAIVTDEQGRPVGIVTEQDVCRKIAFLAAPEQRVDRVMSAPVSTVRVDDYLYRAIALMRRRGLRHMPVVDERDAVVGELELHRALLAAAAPTIALVDALTHEESIEGLIAIKAAQVEVANALLEDGTSAPEIQALLTDVNVDIHRRILRLALAAMAREGWGEPPVAFDLIIMGSGGRGENFLYPDQDNGFVLADYPDAEHGRIDPFFIELAERMTDALAKVGLPHCKGNVMATNPVWRKTISQWKDQVGAWVRERHDKTIILADIFFDFRCGFGPGTLAAALHAFVLDAIAERPGFLRRMYGIEAEHDVALDLFGRLSPRRDRMGTPKNHVNLKAHGTLPLVEGVRLFALREGVGETSTLQRIAALHEKGVLDADEQDYLLGAFTHITFVLLRAQIAAFKADRSVGNAVDPDTLSERERDLLVDSLRAIRDFRQRVRGDFAPGYL